MGCIFSKNKDEDDVVYDMTPIRNLPVIFVNGVPGAGNQTVSQTISNMTGYAMIRPGELQIIVDLIKEAMLMQQEAKGFILVGFPKNPRMSNMFNKQVKWPEKVVALEVDDEVAATRLQKKLSELGRPEAEINAARRLVRDAAHDVKKVQKRFGGHVITVDSNGNSRTLALTLKEILSDTIDKGQRENEPQGSSDTELSQSLPRVAQPIEINDKQ